MIQNLKIMQHQIFDVIILALVVGCRTIVIQIDGVPTERTQFCVGEELTLLCQNNTAVYEWIHPGGVSTVTRSNTIDPENGFTATYVNATTTTLEFVVSSNMSSISIFCTDASNEINISSAYLEVLGISSMTCPRGISALGIDNCTSVNVSLHGVSRCTREYSATISGETEVIASILNEANYGTKVLNIGNFVLSNSSLELCSTYIVSVNVSYFNDSRITCPTVTVELITNPSSDMELLSTTTLPSSNTSSEVTIIVAVVVPVFALILVIAILVMVTIVICVKKSKNNKIEQDPTYHHTSEQAQDSTIIKDVAERSNVQHAQEEKKNSKNQHIILHEKSPSGDMYALPTKNNKGSKKNGKSAMRENLEKSNAQEGDQHIIPHVESPSGEMYAEPKKNNKGSKKNGKNDVREDSTEGNTLEGDQHKIPHKKSPSGEMYALPKKNNKGSKKNGKSDMKENSQKGTTQGGLVSTVINVQTTSKSSPSS